MSEGSDNAGDGGSAPNFTRIEQPEPPALDLSAFILSLAQSVVIDLGNAPHPETGLTQPDLAQAHHTIDIIEMLESKTRGNVSKDEAKLIEGVLYQLRLAYLDAKRRVV